MGVDIDSHGGVVVTDSQMAMIIHEDNREQACRAILRHVARLLQTLKKDSETEELDEWDRQSLQNQSALLTQAFKSLTINSTVGDLRSMLTSMASGVDDGLDSYVKNSDEAIEVWSMLISELYPEAPTPGSTVFIHSPRYQGWDLPVGEVLYAFSEDECFEHAKTEVGAKLDEMLGETTTLLRWTSYSV